MNELLVKEIKMEELLVIDGGTCSWKGAGQYIVRGAITGVRGGLQGAGIGAVIGGVGYGATCWW